MDKFSFQNCQKIVVLRNDDSEVLLCRRKGEADYDGIFSFIGGKMETTDASILDGLRREKNEEVGEEFKIKIYPLFNTMVLFRKKDGNAMVLPHYYAEYASGEIKLSGEYAEYCWVPVVDIKNFEPKIATIPGVIKNLLRLKSVMGEEEFAVI